MVTDSPLGHLSDRVIFVFSARDGTVTTRLNIHVMTNMNIFEMRQRVRFSIYILFINELYSPRRVGRRCD